MAGAPILSHVARGVLGLGGLSEIVVIANDRFAPQFESWARDLDADVPVRVLNDGTTRDDHKLGGDLRAGNAAAQEAVWLDPGG